MLIPIRGGKDLDTDICELHWEFNLYKLPKAYFSAF